MSQGFPLLIEDISEELDPVLDNLLEKNVFKLGNSIKVKLGDKEVDFHENFFLYITTKLANPLYSPEISARTSIIDFAVTMKGLEDQLLGRVILTEKNELEKERMDLIMGVTANQRKMQELEANLLHKLSSTQGSLLDDVTVINVLNTSKSTSKDVKEKIRTAKEAEVKINAAREEFRPVATRGSVLYFLICTMATVNVMYQTSLAQFLERFDMSMAKSEKSHATKKRIQFIITYLNYNIYEYMTKSLFENHKLLFALLMALKIDMQNNRVSFDEFQNFIKGGAALNINECVAKPQKWITDETWLNLVQLSTLADFERIIDQVTRNEKNWRIWFKKNQPEESTIPDDYDKLDEFRKLLLIRAWCPDRTYSESRKYIGWSLGEEFATPITMPYELLYVESRQLTPIICFLSMGSDPTTNIRALAKRTEVPCEAISMGQGQEIHARKLLDICLETGGWILLQNCHLGLGYMNELVGKLIELDKDADSIKETFRIWITTECHNAFPITLLQTAVKFTNEPPSGIRAGLKRTYDSMSQDLLDHSDSPFYLPLIYGVSFLHTIVQERRKFGPLGWNIPYEFNSADWSASCMFMQNHLDSLDPKMGISWATVRYMLGEVQYGGRVTDDYDKRLLNTFAKVWFLDNMFQEAFSFYDGPPRYKIYVYKEKEEYATAIDELPSVDHPQVYGLHSNADIAYQTTTTKDILDTILSVQPKGLPSQRHLLYSELNDDIDMFASKNQMRVLVVRSLAKVSWNA